MKQLIINLIIKLQKVEWTFGLYTKIWVLLSTVISIAVIIDKPTINFFSVLLIWSILSLIGILAGYIVWYKESEN